MTSSLAPLMVSGVLLLSSGCATSIDKARVAWSDGAGDFDEAEQLYLRASEDPAFGDIAREELVEIYLGLAKEQSRKNPEGASRYYAKAVEVDPENAAARTGLARTYRDLGRFDEAIAVVSDPRAKSCGECHRLEAILLVRRGDEAMAASQWDAAEKDYARALELLPDAAVALAVVRARLATKNVREATSALGRAADMLDPADLTSRAQWLELRRAAMTLAVEKEDLPLAETLVEHAPPGAGPEVQLAGELELAAELGKKGKPDLAIERLAALVSAVEAGTVRLAEPEKAALRDRLAELYGARAAVALSSGRVDEAKTDLERATKLRPQDPSFKLQGVLVHAARGKLDDARAALAKLDGVAGHQQISAILLAIEVDQLLQEGKVKPAEAALERAKTLGADLPEVHVAMAQMLAQTQPDLKKPELQELQRNGLISYPGGRVVRVGEALSELDWAKQQIRGLGPAYPYRGPGTKERIEALQGEIKAFYPYTVTFQGEPKTVLVLRNSGSAALNVALRRGSFSTDAAIEAGGEKEVTIPTTGVVTVRRGGTDAAFLAEPYTKVEVAL